MKTFVFLAAGAAIAAAAAPAAAQTYPYAYPQQQQQYQYQYPQQQYAYPQQYQQPGYAYPQTGYAYPGQQGYGQQGVIGQVINQLLGNRYNVTDRNAVSQCATAAMMQASRQYPNNRYAQPQGYAYGQGYAGASNARVTAITDVQRRNNGLRVSGLINSGLQYGGYGNQGYGNPAYAAQGDLTFRCNVDYRGQVTNVRLGRNTAYYRR